MTSAAQPLNLAPATPVLGIASALLAFAMFTGMDTAIKVLGGQYHVVQLVGLNSLFGLGAVVGIAFARGRYRTAYAILVVGGASGLYRIDLATGAANLLGGLDATDPLQGLVVWSAPPALRRSAAARSLARSLSPTGARFFSFFST